MEGLARKARPDSSIPRSSMGLVTVAYAPLLTWANPTLDSLEGQALIPMLGVEPIELGLKGHEQEFFNTLRSGPLYQRLFPKSFREAADVYTLQNITKAIATFERTIISMRFPYDRYRWGGAHRRSRIRPSEENFYSPQASAADAFSATAAGISLQSDSKESRIDEAKAVPAAVLQHGRNTVPAAEPRSL